MAYRVSLKDVACSSVSLRAIFPAHSECLREREYTPPECLPELPSSDHTIPWYGRVYGNWLSEPSALRTRSHIPIRRDGGLYRIVGPGSRAAEQGGSNTSEARYRPIGMHPGGGTRACFLPRVAAAQVDPPITLRTNDAANSQLSFSATGPLK